MIRRKPALLPVWPRDCWQHAPATCLRQKDTSFPAIHYPECCNTPFILHRVDNGWTFNKYLNLEKICGITSNQHIDGEYSSSLWTLKIFFSTGGKQRAVKVKEGRKDKRRKRERKNDVTWKTSTLLHLLKCRNVALTRAPSKFKEIRKSCQEEERRNGRPV